MQLIYSRYELKAYQEHVKAMSKLRGEIDTLEESKTESESSVNQLRAQVDREKSALEDFEKANEDLSLMSQKLAQKVKLDQANFVTNEERIQGTGFIQDLSVFFMFDFLLHKRIKGYLRILKYFLITVKTKCTVSLLNNIRLDIY